MMAVWMIKRLSFLLKGFIEYLRSILNVVKLRYYF